MIIRWNRAWAGFPAHDVYIVRGLFVHQIIGTEGVVVVPPVITWVDLPAAEADAWVEALTYAAGEYGAGLYGAGLYGAEWSEEARPTGAWVALPAGVA